MSEALLLTRTKKFSKETDRLLRLKTTYYHEAYIIEQIFDDERSKDPKFALKYKRFKQYMELHVPLFDYLDYLKFKGFYAVNKDDIVKRLSNSALDYIRTKTVGCKGLMVSEDVLLTHLDKLPKTDIISYEDAYQVFKNIRKVKTKLPGRAPKIRKEPLYTKIELNKLTKNDLIDLCIKLQRDLRRRTRYE